MWVALAAFNIGGGHLEDARVLAARRGLSPDSWSDLKKTLLLRAQGDHADVTKCGTARGGQAVFVETVRAYYDVLLRSSDRTTERDCRSRNESPPGTARRAMR